ncbi:hypothetical protein J5N97_005741 [Dioscorea zingiberensis]|uniref:Uncharacterized protein n=1 Tax=Dioscorea zingiberensis TaxID=325984 RepID=A0A9D5DAZ2_9LILI|nr:hypothetical protein J5N97_005741 [Dioscorea zingiberensis]
MLPSFPSCLLVSDVVVFPLISFLSSSLAFVMPYLAVRLCHDHASKESFYPRLPSTQQDIALQQLSLSDDNGEATYWVSLRCSTHSIYRCIERRYQQTHKYSMLILLKRIVTI